MSEPKLSVVIASYNHQDYIARTLESLEHQTFQDFEIIMIDDGSSDNTVEAAKNCKSRVVIFTQQNKGVVAARNRGIALAKGEYICFVDSDDIVLSDRFERQVKALESDPELGLVFAEALIIDSQGNHIGKFGDVYPVIPGDTAQMLTMHYCFIPMITVMVRTEILKKTGHFRTPGQLCDYMKWIEVTHISKTYYDKKPLGCWRRHQKSTSINLNQFKKYTHTRIGLKRIMRKYPELRAQLGPKIVKRFSRSYFLTGFWFAANGDIIKARKYYRKAIKVYPYSPENWGGLILTSMPIKNLVIKLHRYVRTKKLPW